ncbi:MAG TPA: nucleotidyltransferase domain-containing protein [Gemmatales bacterium]|nr:nucleotidyltransferase domain-containing protein [Gemmatales bacterium]
MPKASQQIRVLNELAALERQHRVTLLYACEAGSRVWGFPAADSDYDVRFIYVRPRQWYKLPHSPTRRPAIVRQVGRFDMIGWDLRKVLARLHLSQPTVLEWLASDQVYFNLDDFQQAANRVADSTFSAPACLAQYVVWARRNYDKFFDQPRRSTKHYCLVMRPLLAALWLERGWGRPPLSLARLSARLISWAPLKTAIDQLLEPARGTKKRVSGQGLRVVEEFMAGHFSRLSHIRMPRAQVPSAIPAPLNRLFRKLVERYDTSTDEEIDLTDFRPTP